LGMTKKIVVAVLTALMLSTTLVGCDDNQGSSTQVEEVDANIDTGVVQSRSRKSVTVLEDDGELDTHRVSKSTSRKCTVGKRWPDCKR
jgi:uncharacterized lipoprotein NlpE involved in copper resistance